MAEREIYEGILVHSLELKLSMAERQRMNAVWITTDVLKDILTLVRKREAVNPNIEHSARGLWYTCGHCGWKLFEVRDTATVEVRKRVRFCASCGRQVKWGDD